MRAAHQYTVLLLAVVTAHTVFAQDTRPREIARTADPRPLSSLIKSLEGRCHCVITYEDPKWDVSQLIDAPVPHPPNVHPHIPRGGPLALVLDGMIPNSPDSARSYLELAARVSDERGYGAFQVAASADRVFHVVPTAGSVLTPSITFASETKEMGQFVTAILSDVQAANGEQTVVVTGPPDLMKTRITAEADHEPADLVLTRVVSAAGPRLSWQMFYDVDSQKYFLDVHVVE
jgi:hypothetical protein